MKTIRCTRKPPGKPRCRHKGPESEFATVEFNDGLERRYCPACAQELWAALAEAGCQPSVVENTRTGEVRAIQSTPTAVN